MTDHPSGRSYARTYERVHRREHHDFVEAAVQRSGGKVLWSSGPAYAPLFVVVEEPDGSRVGLMIYAFLAKRTETTGRPVDEHRGQLRYGNVNDPAWRSEVHPVGFDPASLDTTLMLVVEPDADAIVALDPRLYDPMPLGISVYWRDAEVEGLGADGWNVWEQDNFSGSRRRSPRSELGVETMVGFRPHRLLDYARFERQAQRLGLDAPLRYQAALQAAAPRVDMSDMHELERAFGLSSSEILSVIAERARLSMAVRGGVAERHMHQLLVADPAVGSADVGHQEGPPDFFVRMRDGRSVTVEVKNASPKLRAVDGAAKVEVQKTRASQGDPMSRFYEPSAFDVIAACMYGPTGRWEFRFKRSTDLTEHAVHAGRIAPMQYIDASWASTLLEALDA